MLTFTQIGHCPISNISYYSGILKVFDNIREKDYHRKFIFPKYITRFYIIKATSAKAVEVSFTHGLWQFGNQTEKRLLKAIKVRLF